MRHFSVLDADGLTLESTGRASGVVVAGFYVGLLLSPLTVGSILTVGGSYAVAWSVLAGLLLTAGLLLHFRPFTGAPL